MKKKETAKTGSQKLKDQAIKGAKKFIDQLPKAVEKSPLLQSTLVMIVDMQQQAKSIQKDANEEVHKILEVLHHSYGDIEAKARHAGDKAKKQAQDGLGQLLEKWHEKKGALPKKFTNEMDSLLQRVGLTKTKKPSAKSKKSTSSTKKSTTATKKKPTTKAKPAATKKLVIKKVVPNPTK